MSSEFPADPYSAAQQKWMYQDHLVLPTLKNLLEEQIEGKTVLDIGCGNGRNSLTFLEWGARKVVGFDNSAEMMKSLTNSPNLEYHHLDVTNFSLNDHFDIAIAIFVLQYVHDKDQLMKGISLISEHINPRGFLIGIIPNGQSGVKPPSDAGQRLGAAIEKRGDPYVDGELVTAQFFEGNEVKCTSTMALHSNEFYEKCFKEVGFKTVEWLSPTISASGRELLGESFVHQFLNPPADIVFRCSK